MKKPDLYWRAELKVREWQMRLIGWLLLYAKARLIPKPRRDETGEWEGTSRYPDFRDVPSWEFVSSFMEGLPVRTPDRVIVITEQMLTSLTSGETYVRKAG